MKTAIFIQDGTVQLVLTPENDFEKNALGIFKDKGLVVKVFSGSFAEAKGGWIRHYESDNSLILRIDEEKEPQK